MMAAGSSEWQSFSATLRYSRVIWNMFLAICQFQLSCLLEILLAMNDFPQDLPGQIPIVRGWPNLMSNPNHCC